MIKKIILAILFTIPSLSFTMDLDSYYITAKGGVSKTRIQGRRVLFFITGLLVLYKMMI